MPPKDRYLVGNTADERVCRVAVGEEGADAEEDLGDGEGGAPVVLQDVQADDALGVDVAVVDTGLEGHLQEEYFIVQFIKFKF